MVMLALDRRSSLLPLLSEGTRFTMSILGHDQAEHALAAPKKGPEQPATRAVAN
jgi:flavin reductase (DIM6/NTAB) family NADH-FMN oxidoreductase RutF